MVPRLFSIRKCGAITSVALELASRLRRSNARNARIHALDGERSV